MYSSINKRRAEAAKLAEEAKLHEQWRKEAEEEAKKLRAEAFGIAEYYVFGLAERKAYGSPKAWAADAELFIGVNAWKAKNIGEKEVAEELEALCRAIRMYVRM